MVRHVRRAGIVLILSGVHAVFTLAGAAQEITYDWSSQSLSGLPVHAGRVQRVRVEYLNPLCFTNTVRTQAERVPLNTTAVGNILRPTGSPAPNPATNPATVPTPQSTPTTGSGGVNVPVVAIPSGSVDLGAARTLLLAWTKTLGRVETHRQVGERHSSTLANLNCATAPNARFLLDDWRANGSAALDTLRQSETILLRGIDELRSRLDDLPSTPATATLRTDFMNLIAFTERLRNTVPPVAQRFFADAPRLSNAAERSTIVHEVEIDQDVRALRVVVSSTPLGGGNPTADTLNVEVRRRIRTVFSTGILGTGADSYVYDRVNRQRIRNGQPTDSVYSTFGRTGGSSQDLLNPALLVSVSVFRVPQVESDLYVTAGTTLRTVGIAGQALEPVLGLSIGFLDQFLLSVGVHHGREEVLLLPEGVDDRAVPSAVTRKDAVGTNRKLNLFLGFSLRVN
jgi:hypothetical protein